MLGHLVALLPEGPFYFATKVGATRVVVRTVAPDATGLEITSTRQHFLSWDIRWTLLLKDQPANKLLARLPGWRQAYVDDKSMIFVRER